MITHDELMRVQRWHPNGTVDYAVVGKLGGVHFWISPLPAAASLPGGSHYGGVEYHRAHPPAGKPHSNIACWLLSGNPCYHDGSSLYAEEVYLPSLLDFGEDAIWRRLEMDYQRMAAEAEELAP
jgi:hypothetical protein